MINDRIRWLVSLIAHADPSPGYEVRALLQVAAGLCQDGPAAAGRLIAAAGIACQVVGIPLPNMIKAIEVVHAECVMDEIRKEGS